MRLIAEFLDIHVDIYVDIRVSNEIMQEVCRRSSFEYMKTIDERFAPYRGAPWRKRGRMMRRGEQGRSSELLSAEQQEQIDRSCVAELKRERSDLPYDQTCGRSDVAAEREVTDSRAIAWNKPA